MAGQAKNPFALGQFLEGCGGSWEKFDLETTSAVVNEALTSNLRNFVLGPQSTFEG